MSNLSAKNVIFRVRDANGDWQDYSKQVSAGFWQFDKMPDRQAGGVLGASAQIQLLARPDLLPVNNYADASLFKFKAECDIQLRAVDGNFYYLPTKMFIHQATPEFERGMLVGCTLELVCTLKLNNRESSIDSRSLDIKTGGKRTLSVLATRALVLAGMGSTVIKGSLISLSAPRGFGNNYVAAAAKLLDSAKLVAWAQPVLASSEYPQGTGGTVFIDELKIDEAVSVRSVDMRQGGMLRFDPFQEPRNPDNQNLLADEYLTTSTCHAWTETPSRTVEDNSQVDINFSAGTVKTTVTETEAGESLYAGLPGNYPSGEETSQVSIQTKQYNTSGDKALVQIEERTDLRVAIIGQAAKGYLAGIYERLTAKEADSGLTGEESTQLNETTGRIGRYSWSNLQQGARNKTTTISYAGDGRITQTKIIEEMTLFEVLAGLGNGVDWDIVLDSGLILTQTITTRTTTTNRFKTGDRWCEKTVVTCLKCMGTEAHRASINYRLAQAYQGNAEEGEEPDPNEALYNQVIQDALRSVTMPPQQIRTLGNGETKPGSIDTMPERYTAEQVQISSSKVFPTTSGIELKQALSMEYPGDFKKVAFGGEQAARSRQQIYANTIGLIVRSRQRQRNCKGPLWPEILFQWRPWMAIDVTDLDGITYRCAFDGIRLMFSQQECYWEQQLMQLGTVGSGGNFTPTPI